MNRLVLFTKKILQIIKVNPRGLMGGVRWCLTIVQIRLKYFKTHELKKSYGNEMQDKVFYVIGTYDGWCGLFAIVRNKLTHIAYAVERGYIPVIDLQNYDNQYIDKHKLFEENAWEYFFEQPMGYSLQDIKKAQNIVKSVIVGCAPNAKYNLGNYNNLLDPDVRAYYKDIFSKYVRFNHESENFCQTRHKELFKNKDRVLGVICRGTDFISLKPKDHPIQPDPIDMIKKAEEVLSEYRCDYLYLATEDANIYDLFVQHFGDKLIQNNYSTRVSDLKKREYLGSRAFLAGKSEITKNALEYLSDIYLLSQCTCFIGGQTSGAFGALLMPNKFEYTYIFDLGLYQ